MKLTGKCKEEFEKWYLQGVHKEGNYDQYVMRTFYSKSVSMQFGVYVDFFDSVEIDIGVIRNKLGTFNSWCSKYDEFDTQTRALPTQDSRLKARLKAIEKANEIYNEL